MTTTYKNVMLVQPGTGSQNTVVLVPYVPDASSSVSGLVKVDGTSITINDGVISATGGGSSSGSWADWEAGVDPDQWVY